MRTRSCFTTLSWRCGIPCIYYSSKLLLLSPSGSSPQPFPMTCFPPGFPSSLHHLPPPLRILHIAPLPLFYHPPPNNSTLRQSVDKRTIIENYDLVSLAIDEIVDDGIILETDPLIITQRVSRAPTQDVVQLKGIDLSEQGMNTLAQYGKNKLGDWLRQGL